ncbi:MAG: NYN domain-containing protein [Lachnospiraceae bacterium]|nr:NYN domain-containing protein [Lachnospiraceae bacterium]
MDILKYIQLVKKKYVDVNFIRTYYFTSQTANNAGFLQQINKIPYTQVVTGRLQNKTIKIDNRAGIKCPKCGDSIIDTFVTQVDKGTDVNIAVEMLKHAYNGAYDIAVLISRDADFAGVVKIIKDLGMITFPISQIDGSDDFEIDMEELRRSDEKNNRLRASIRGNEGIVEKLKRM